MVRTALGLLEGLEREDCEVFLGVPYGAPPVGELRWRSPQPVQPWQGVRQATTFPPMAPQPDIRGMELYGREFYDEEAYFPGQGEDCLYLNIWCPKGERKNLPVVVWFHGGAFDHGSAYEKEFDGAAYARRGVILVTAAYRLGALGYLYHPEQGAEGNYGLQDQVQALRWVREHIGAFGGDGDSVTIMGQSAGAISVQLLCSTHATDRLFRKAILQSGAGFADLPGRLVSRERARGYAASLLEKLHCDSLDQARQRPWQEVLAAALETAGGEMAFAPVEGGALVAETPEERWQALESKHLAFLAGATADDMFSGAGQEGPMFQGAKAFVAKAAPHRSGVYYFDHPLPGSDDGAFHSGELWYSFGTWRRCWRPMRAEDAALSERMLDYWSGFIATGDPNALGDWPEWPPYDQGNVMVLS